MRRARRVAGAVAAGLVATVCHAGVAITVDDLPWSGARPRGETSRQALQRIASTLRDHGAPATGFVVCDRAARQDSVLRLWVGRGLTLANHTAAHRDLDDTPVEEWLVGVRRCDAFLRRFASRSGGTSRHFRYPMLHEGVTSERRAAARAGIEALGLRVAPVTVDTSDWLLAAAYGRALERRDAAARGEIGRAFVAHVTAAVDHADQVARRKLGRPLPQVLLLHATALVADHLDALLRELERRGERFLRLEEALADPAYALPDGYVGPRGLSWLYRMEPATPADVEWDLAEERAIQARFGRFLDARGREGRP